MILTIEPADAVQEVEVLEGGHPRALGRRRRPWYAKIGWAVIGNDVTVIARDERFRSTGWDRCFKSEMRIVGWCIVAFGMPLASGGGTHE